MATSGSLNFVSASDVGITKYAPDQDKWKFGTTEKWDNESGASHGGFIPVDFAGLNTIIYEPLTSSANHLGYSLPIGILAQERNADRDYVDSGNHQDANRMTYFNEDVIRLVYYAGKAGSIWGTPPINNPGSAAGLNAVLLHRNGPYGHTTWKQIRTANHPVARYQRLHNTMSVDSELPTPAKKMLFQREQDDYREDILAPDLALPGSDLPRHRRFKTKYGKDEFYEPVVTSKHKPFIYEITIDIPDQGITNIAVARQTLFNNVSYFSNEDINDKLNLTHSGYTEDNPTYTAFYTAKKLNGRNYSTWETIFPKEVNAYRQYKLAKPNYEEITGYLSNGFDRNPREIRSFWKKRQDAYDGSSSAQPGSCRFRSIGRAEPFGETPALNSQDVKQDFGYDPRLSLYLRAAGGPYANVSKFIHASGTGPQGTASFKHPSDVPLCPITSTRRFFAG